MARLALSVWVEDEDGAPRLFTPADDVPSWAKSKITNPAAWGEEAADTATELAAEEDVDGPPPQGGAGASRQVWADYAGKHGVKVESSWKRDDIIAACEKAGVAV